MFLGEEFCVSFPEVVNLTCSLHSTISMVLAFLEDIFPTTFPTVIPKENEYILINGNNNSGHLLLKSPQLMSPWSPNLCLIFPFNLYLQLAFAKMQALIKLN